MTLTQSQLARAASETGFQAEALEKALRLLPLLEALRSHPFLSDRMVLKGGTALNLFVLDLPRLSVDIDLNYVGAADRQTMMSERPKVEEAIRAVCAREGLRVRRMPDDHAGGKWRLTYERVTGGTATLELDVNFLHRVPLWDPVIRDSIEVAGTVASKISVLDAHDLAGGKLSALLSRRASRDMFDAIGLLDREDFDREKLRIAFVVYGAMSRRDWRTVAVEDVGLESDEARRQLIPLLRADLVPRDRLDEWCAHKLAACRGRLRTLLPFEPREVQFLDQINGAGQIVPELLTDDATLRARIRDHPGLLWKVLNVRQHASGSGAKSSAHPDSSHRDV